jgi:hypothetical protein
MFYTFVTQLIFFGLIWCTVNGIRLLEIKQIEKWIILIVDKQFMIYIICTYITNDKWFTILILDFFNLLILISFR